VLNRGGGINRKKLGEIVFADKKKIAELNRIVHPALKETIDQRLKTTDQKPLIVINAAVLKEIGLIDLVDEVWVVTASRENRLKRLLKAGLSKKSALQRINSQMPQKEYLALADQVIENNGTIRQLNAKIQTHL
ncbi:MAG: dephospho-CoA kinase, partial [Candidatus Margulisiibacteriota bacterium]